MLLLLLLLLLLGLELELADAKIMLTIDMVIASLIRVLKHSGPGE